MKKFITLILVVLLTQVAYCQSAFTIIKAISKNSVRKGTLVCRTVRTLPKNYNVASRALLYQNPEKFLKTSISDCDIKITTEFKVPTLRSPETIYGGYNYLRFISSISKQKGSVYKEYLKVWNKINNSYTYNGAHHIVNKSTLKEIHHRMKLNSRHNNIPFNVSLDEMQRNAPAIFHILHGNPNYKNIFHNMERQLEIYEEYGIKGILDDFFSNLETYGYPVSKQVIKGTYLEAELWARTYNLRW